MREKSAKRSIMTATACVLPLIFFPLTAVSAQESGSNATLEIEIKSLTNAVKALQTEITDLKQRVSASGASSSASRKIFLRKDLVQLGLDLSCGKSGAPACGVIAQKVCTEIGYSASVKARIVPIPEITPDGNTPGSFLAAVMCR